MMRTGRQFILLRALLAAGWLVVCCPVHADSSNIIAYVNGDSISTEMVRRELVRLHASGVPEAERSDFSLERLVQKVIDNKLLTQEARLIGLDLDPEISKRVTRYREDLAYRDLLNDAIPDTFTVSRAEIFAEYARDFQRFDLRLLCVNDSLLADMLADSIRQGASMAQLAMVHSVDRFRDVGGAAGSYTLLEAPIDLRPYLLRSHAGELIGPLYLWRLYSLVRVEDRIEADTTRFDTLRPFLEKRLLDDKRRAARREYADRLRSEIPVKVDSAAIDSVIERMRLGLEASDRPVLTVGASRVFTGADLRNAYIHRVVGHSAREARTVLWDALDDQARIMLLQEATVRAGYLNRTRYDEPVTEFEDSLLVLAYLEEVVSGVEVSPEEIAAYYQEHLSDFRTRPRLNISTLTRKTLTEAQEDYRKIEAGTDFAWLARHNSIDDARDKGGERGWMSASELPPYVYGSVDTLEIGGVSQPIPVEGGFALYQVVDRQQGDLLPLSHVKDQIELHLQRVKQTEAVDATIRKLRESADITILQDVLRGLRVVGQVK
jgi:parvulin-like peptidyl-prolyl isomerase